MMESEYFGSTTLKQVLAFLQKWKGRASVVAGGTNFIPNMRSGAIVPEAIVDLTALQGLSYIREQNGVIGIGALTAIAELAESEIIRRECPILSSAASQLGNPLTRNRATIGGNLADASPAADTAPPLLALEASIHTERGNGEGRDIRLEDFFRGPHLTVLEPDEIIREITLPKQRDPSQSAYLKLGLRNAMAISVVSVAVMLDMDGETCRKARIAFGAVAPRPIRANRVEAMLEGSPLGAAIIEKCSALIQEEISPINDIRASADYRRRAASVLFKRAIGKARK